MIRRDNGFVLRYYYGSRKPTGDFVQLPDTGAVKRCVMKENEET